MSSQTCAACGESNAAGSPFCSACGAFLEWDGDATEEVAASSAPPVRPADQVDTRSHTAVDVAPVVPTSPAPRPAAPTPSPAEPNSSPAPPRAASAAVPSTANVPAAPVIRLPSSGPRSAAARAAAAPVSTQPTMPGQSVDAVSSVSSPVAPGEVACPSCGTPNSQDRRFCKKCGQALNAAAPTPTTTSVTEAEPKKSRWFNRGSTQSAAKRAYRGSTPMRYRVTRVIGAVVIVGIVGGLLALLGQNPVQWITDRWADIRGTLVTVDKLSVLGEPASTAVADFPAASAVDGFGNSAWAIPWSGQVPKISCAPPSRQVAQDAPGSLLILIPEPVKVRAIKVAAGLAKTDVRRLQQWRPKTLQLAFSDGTCQKITLKDTAAVQQIKIDPVMTTQIRVNVLDALVPQGPPQNFVAISEIQLLTRPNPTA